MAEGGAAAALFCLRVPDEGAEVELGEALAAGDAVGGGQVVGLHADADALELCVWGFAGAGEVEDLAVEGGVATYAAFLGAGAALRAHQAFPLSLIVLLGLRIRHTQTLRIPRLPSRRYKPIRLLTKTLILFLDHAHITHPIAHPILHPLRRIILTQHHSISTSASRITLTLPVYLNIWCQTQA